MSKSNVEAKYPKDQYVSSPMMEKVLDGVRMLLLTHEHSCR
jgi:hypothetical protein